MRVFKINRFNAHVLNELNGTHNGTVLFFHPQCSHCIALKPQWEETKRQLSKKDCNIYEVNGEDMNNISHPMTNVIDGFPSIINVNHGKLTQFEKERNIQNMKDFIMSNLAQNKQVRNQATRKLKKRKVSFNINKNQDLMKQKRILTKNKIKNSIRLLREKRKKRISKKKKKGKKGSRL
jgi:thiol-disulfide isomerase/thioredoxin